MTDIKPALSAEEWASWKKRGTAFLPVWVEDGAISPDPDNRHAAAALCLHGQSFGFTREDVRMLRGGVEVVYFAEQAYGDNHTESQGLCDLADRIEALLPPEEMNQEKRHFKQIRQGCQTSNKNHTKTLKRAIKHLADAGFFPWSVAEMTDEELLDIENIGVGCLEALRREFGPKEKYSSEP